MYEELQFEYANEWGLFLFFCRRVLVTKGQIRGQVTRPQNTNQKPRREE